MTKFESKLKLYCVLQGNQFDPLREDYKNGVNCGKCRARHNGICNVRYFNYHVLYEIIGDNGGRILKMALGGLNMNVQSDHYESSDNYTYFRERIIDGVSYPYYSTGLGWICFGFLDSE
jgi:hypothetical protein